MIDDGCTVDGYNSDITRTFVLGKATDKMKRVFDVVHRAQSAALKAATPGVHIRGEYGVRLEDEMHIAENGAELFTPQSPSIEQPFG